MISLYKHMQKKKAEKTDKAEPNAPPPCAHRSEPPPEPCLDCKAEKTAARTYRWKIILGLVWPYALQALDATIIASALPWIASDFGKISQQNWIVSAFNLTSAAFIPFWTQMADVFGRNASINAAVILMLVGSALCTGSPTSTFPVLLLGRGFQGIAAAGLNVLIRVILADRVSLKENASNWAIFSLVGGISYALGPVIGGYLTRANWRWCFGINLPIGVFALLVIFFVLRKELLGPQPIPELQETAETGRRTKLFARVKTIDFGGQVLFLFGFGLIILALTWGGDSYSWDSAAVLAPLIIGVALVVVFVLWERSAAPGRTIGEKMPWQKPMIPWNILSSRDMGLLFFIEMANGMCMFAVLYFCNVYFISVQNYDSDKAGLQLLYFTPGIGVGVYLCTMLLHRWPRMTFAPIFLGAIVEAVAIGVLAYGLYTEHRPTIFGLMAMVGAGTGLRFMASPLHGIGLFRHQRATVIGLFALAIPLGGTIGLTIMSTVFNNTSGLNSNSSDFSKLRDLPDGEREAAIHNVKMSVVWAFVSIAPFALLAWFFACFLGNVKLGEGSGPDEDGSQNIVISEVYLWTLVRGRNRRDEERGLRLGSSHEMETRASRRTSRLYKNGVEN